MRWAIWTLVVAFFLFLFFEWETSILVAAPCEQPQGYKHENAQADQCASLRSVVFKGREPVVSRLGRWLDTHNGAVSAFAALIIAAFTGTLWIATSRQAELTREALIADKRAFIFPINLNGFWEQEQTSGQYNWRFRPRWMNSGDTPSKNFASLTGCEFRDTPLPAGFAFTTGITPGGGLLPPKLDLSGGIAPQWPTPAITPQDILDVQAGKKFLYLWGWARYNDVFPGTPQHVTRFCWMITPIGDPTKYIPGKVPPDIGGLIFGFIHHIEGNCADDECP